MPDYRGQRRGANLASDRGMQGNAEFLALSRRLKEAGRTDLRKELAKTMRDLGKPLIAATRQSALRQLPRSGGLAAFEARKPQRVRVRTGARTAGVSIAMSGQQGILTGELGHPVFNKKKPGTNRRLWVRQQVSGDWWDDRLIAEQPRVAAEMLEAMERVAFRITGPGT